MDPSGESVSEEEAIRVDRQAHPHCHYSTSIQQFFSFSSEAGQSNETQRTIMRICPGERPVPIFKKKDSNKSDGSDGTAVDHWGNNGHFPGMPGGQSPLPGGSEGIESLINSFFGGGMFGGGGRSGSSLFGSDDLFGGIFGNDHNSSSSNSSQDWDFHTRRLPPPHGGVGHRNNNTDPRDSQRDRIMQSVLQPPHTLPKGTSPSVGPYNDKKSLRGEAVSPPESI